MITPTLRAIQAQRMIPGALACANPRSVAQFLHGKRLSGEQGLGTRTQRAGRVVAERGLAAEQDGLLYPTARCRELATGMGVWV
jgi:hypothetical protein